MSDEHRRWVDDRQIVRGFAGYIGGRDHTHFTGKVIGYQESPTVTVETDDGQRVHWAAHLCEPVQPEPVEKPCDMCVKADPWTWSGPENLCPPHLDEYRAWCTRTDR